jgi:hypothetical protein
MAAVLDVLSQRRSAGSEKFLRAFHSDHFNLLLTSTAPGNNRMPAHAYNPVRFRLRYGSFAYMHLSPRREPGRPALSATFGRFTGPCQPKSSRVSRRHEHADTERPEPLLCSRKEQVATILREGESVRCVRTGAAEFTPSPKLIVSDQAEATSAAANWSDNRPSPARGAMIVCFVRNVFIGSPPATIEGVEPASPSE